MSQDIALSDIRKLIEEDEAARARGVIIARLPADHALSVALNEFTTGNVTINGQVYCFGLPAIPDWAKPTHNPDGLVLETAPTAGDVTQKVVSEADHLSEFDPESRTLAE